MSDPTVFVVDDDDAVRDSVKFLLDSVGLSVRCFGSAEDFLRFYEPSMRGCLLLDVRMPGMSGTQLQEKLAHDGVPLPVIILTGHSDVPMAVKAMRAGAFDFLEKPANDQVLLERVRAALETERQVREDHEILTEVEDRLATLTPREREVMEFVVAGYLNKQIAEILSVSIKTVEAHRARVMEKMRAESLASLVRMAIRAGIE